MLIFDHLLEYVFKHRVTLTIQYKIILDNNIKKFYKTSF